MTKKFLLARLSRIAIIATLLVIPFLTVSAQISLPTQKMSLQEVTKRISAQSTYKFFYNDDIASTTISVSEIDNKSIEQTLDAIFKNSEITYHLNNNVIYLSRKEITDNTTSSSAYIVQ